jgi:outer membrane protein assembly factor BamA
MKSLLLGCLLLAGAIAVAQAPPCFRSKFAVEPPARIKHLQLYDNGQLSSKDKAEIIRELKHQCDCWPCVVGEEVGQQIREMYQWRGYFQAVAEVNIRQLGGGAWDIDARIQEGPRYRLKDIEFAHASAFPVEQLRGLFNLAPGQLYDTRKITEGLQHLRHLYGTRGYLNFTAVPDAEADAASATVALHIDVDEGPVFRLGKLLVTGIDPARGLGRQLLEAWQPHVGEVYNTDFVDNFLEQIPGVGETRLPKVTYIQDANTRTVALRVAFPHGD